MKPGLPEYDEEGFVISKPVVHVSWVDLKNTLPRVDLSQHEVHWHQVDLSVPLLQEVEGE